MDATANAVRPIRSALGLAVLGLAGWLVAFVQVVIVFAALAVERNPALGGADAALGFPVGFVALGLFAFVIAIAVSRLGGSGFARWFSIGTVVIVAAGAAFLGWATITAFSLFGLIQFLLALAAVAITITWLRRSETAAVPPAERQWALGGFLVLTGVLGFLASVSLAIDKVIVFVDPAAPLNCSISIVVNCATNLNSGQGAVFGFPNPLIGLGGFLAPFVVGLAILAGARFDRWFWIAFNLGLLGAFTFVAWLISQSIFVLGSLCLWCALVWSVTIPSFLLVTFRNLARGVYGRGPRRVGSALYGFTPFITLLFYIAVLAMYQAHLDLIHAF
jgi:uncharacterized membrane protein